MKNETYIADIPQSGKIRLVRYGDLPQGSTNHICSVLELHMPAEKPWKLGRSVNGFTLAEGQEWHRDDFTLDMLPEGTRPSIYGEDEEDGDEWLSWNNEWNVMTPSHLHSRSTEKSCHSRTRRPLPDPYARLKAAHAAGKVIEVREHVDSNEWFDRHSPNFNSPIELYRIKPVPALDADGWIPHDGGECPVVCDTLVDYKLKSGFENTAVAYNLKWQHVGSGGDITHYRLAKPSEKKFVPWTRETCPPLPFEVIEKSTGNRYCVWMAAKKGTNFKHWQGLLDNYTRADGTPCGEEAK